MLVAGTAPGSGYVGEIILRDLVSFAGPAHFHCVGLVPTKYQWQPDPALQGLSVELHRVRYGSAKRWSRAAWGAAGSVLNHITGLTRERSALAAIVAEGARSRVVDQVFAVLDSPMMFGIAHRVASRLGVPLLTLVWDPPEYLLMLGRFDRWSRKSLLAEFNRSLSMSSRVAVVSENMRAEYARLTNAPIQILRHGLPVSPRSSVQAGPRDEWLIGFAGSMYSPCAWNAFVAALDNVGWQLAGKQVRLRVLGASIQIASRSAAKVEYLGYRSSDEVQALLSDCDACYLPQPFASHLRELCRYSFPTKLTNYLALGVPVIAHAPDYAAVAPFLKEHSVGVHVTSIRPDAIAAALEDFFANPEARLRAASEAHATAKSMFSANSFQAAIVELLSGGARQTA